MRLFSDNRASSTAVQYMLTFTIGLLVLSSLTVTLEDITERQEEKITVDHLEYVGNEISVQLLHQHRLVQDNDRTESIISDAGGSVSGGGIETTVYLDTPEEITCQGYSAQISSDGNELIMRSSQLSIETSVPIDPSIPVRANSGATGGKIQIIYDSAQNELYLQSTDGV